MKTPIVKCSACCGKGVRKLSGALLRTFNIIHANANEGCTIPQIHRIQGEDLHSSASNQRVRKLVRLGLVKKRKVMGRMLYSVV